MPSSVRPGSHLAGRYLLQEVDRGEGGGIPVWDAHDDMLQRRVSLRILAADDPRAGSVVEAAQRAAMLDDPRFLSVLDAAESDGLVVLVTEWVAARTLTDLLTDGPLPALHARRLAGEVARALSRAHRAGLAHRRLGPGTVLVTEDHRVKIVGLAIDAALDGLPFTVDDDAAAGDLHASGAVLYAALTGRWPHLTGVRPTVVLPPAPRRDDAPCSPRQVRAAVPPVLDEITVRAMGTGDRRSGPPFADAGEFADALLGPASGHTDPGTGPLPIVTAEDDDVPLLAVREDGGSVRRVSAAVVGVVLAVAVSVLAWQVVDAVGADDRAPLAAAADPTPSPKGTAASPSASPSAPPTPRPLDATASTFDPEGNGQENDGQAALAVDAAGARTAWTTQRYERTGRFGNLKPGVGLVLDLGAEVDVSAVDVNFGSDGTLWELRAATSATDTPPDSLEDYAVVERESTGRAYTTALFEPVTTRYLMLWLTEIPPVDGGKYQGSISNVVVRGLSAKP